MKLYITLMALCLGFNAFAQEHHDTIVVRKTTVPIKVDGVMDEAWANAAVAKDFWQYFPMDTALAMNPTEVRMLYDDNFIYYLAIARSRTPDVMGSYITPSLRRDFRGEANDAVTLTMDPFQDETNAFQFGVNPFGVQREGLLTNGANTSADLDQAWDNKWFADAKQYKGYWIAEMAVPFKTLRYKENSQFWNVKFYRISSDGPERSSWPKVPRQYPIINLAFHGVMAFEQVLKKPGANVSLIPYSLVNYTENRVDQLTLNRKLNFGGDAKIAVGPALNLDLTVNPDFSQVEVDQQVANLDRFEIFFPERRQFFLENADLFAGFGSENLRPFFSRRIGIAKDTATGLNVQNPIYVGARLSGKLDKNWRMGLLSMQSARDYDISQPSTNYTVGVLQRKVFARSNIGFIAINKQPLRDKLLENAIYDYNRVVGVDYNLASNDNKWTGKFFHHRSFDAGLEGQDNGVTAATISYTVVNWDFDFTAQDVGANFNPEVGFARRTDYRRAAGNVNWKFYPKKGALQSHGPGLDFDVLGNERYGTTDWDLNLMYQFRFRSSTIIDMRLRREFIYLFDAFDPTNSEGVELPEGSSYAYNLLRFNVLSDARKRVYVDLSGRIGQYFNGTRINLEGTINYRKQPFGIFGLNFSYNRIRLPEPYSDANFILIGPKIDLSFSRSLFWTTFIQYNNQINNVNINSRLQWRFRPVSDIFLVYTDNYYSDTYVNKNRAVVLKCTYWLNL
ncbi:DUF5916 domain-containing protein [Haliscomenobacter hydrossis]|uniref:Membrane associated hydrolase n=1 Tax=Haliscomenobacter hydrossis (strain ATCC 27775 / DSM 1100 / LMG 10767 / O) TaxID=760192 RepID=F4L0I9_HALH1|nr:DUF5916 domain-containing protein [Haliscomenobacter hydrossis]AEE48501.1 putative membrane associated hydrolase [Haliscomenobacter hydrossis DSM 1100]